MDNDASNGSLLRIANTIKIEYKILVIENVLCKVQVIRNFTNTTGNSMQTYMITYRLVVWVGVVE